MTYSTVILVQRTGTIVQYFCRLEFRRFGITVVQYAESNLQYEYVLLYSSMHTGPKSRANTKYNYRRRYQP